MGITKREIASELGVSKRTVANYIEKLGLGNHVSRNGNTDFLDDFAAAAIADALKNPGKPSRQPADAPAAPAPDSLVDSLAAQLEIERSRNAELMEALAAERDRAARAEAEAKAQLAEANARVAELAGKLASLAERQQRDLRGAPRADGGTLRCEKGLGTALLQGGPPHQGAPGRMAGVHRGTARMGPRDEKGNRGDRALKSPGSKLPGRSLLNIGARSILVRSLWRRYP